MAIAKCLGIEVQAKPTDQEGVSGMLLKQGNSFGIMYATHIKSIGFQRFSIAHELGHYLLDGHVEQILPDGDGIHMSSEGFTSNDPYEIEADNFASSLLMPSELFQKEMRKITEGLSAIKKLSNICETSLQATAIRYINFAEEPCAIVVSNGEVINYAFMSESLKQFSEIEWIKKGSAVPKGTLTNMFVKKGKDSRAVAEDSSFGDLSDWFSGNSIEMQEDVIVLGGYGKLLTVITVTQDMDEYDFDDDLDQSLEAQF